MTVLVDLLEDGVRAVGYLWWLLTAWGEST